MRTLVRKKRADFSPHYERIVFVMVIDRTGTQRPKAEGRKHQAVRTKICRLPSTCCVQAVRCAHKHPTYRGLFRLEKSASGGLVLRQNCGISGDSVPQVRAAFCGRWENGVEVPPAVPWE